MASRRQPLKGLSAGTVRKRREQSFAAVAALHGATRWARDYRWDVAHRVFCRIVDGHAGASVVDENADTVAVLDVNPIAPGHTLVVPRAHTEDLWSVDASRVRADSGRRPASRAPARPSG
jgi:hypothetical protein